MSSHTDYSDAYAAARARADQTGRDVDHVPDWSPWGKIQTRTAIKRGVWIVSTASHGGVWLSPDRRKQMPPRWQRFAWFEEDCQAAYPLLRFGSADSGIDLEQCRLSIARWHRYQRRERIR